MASENIYFVYFGYNFFVFIRTQEIYVYSRPKKLRKQSHTYFGANHNVHISNIHFEIFGII